ncbi:Glycosyl hydrolase family [Bifidobacterium ramosum]|uniref:Glycosyl hydrolase family n=1 Tax=Bifidobacterium ramosum TaxID=1798158 RepID=A0A6L4WYE9_9BIFI|nr:glycosyl hydrolase 115 family protein [Bifidobacterium ramosum]KAB8287328.1 Glycosyl hydrolase family [Bifidobacterium ramosum]NEG72402.1 hypothetical protein [Bifidobacterium ramosum]
MKIYANLNTPSHRAITPAAPVIVDSAYQPSERDPHAERTWRQVTRAVQDLRQDIAMTTGSIDWHTVQQLFADDPQAQADRLAAADPSATPALIRLDSPESALRQFGGDAPIDRAIIVGTIGRSAIIDTITANGRLDESEQIADRQEAFALKEVDDPIPGVAHAIVIAGSDARGTIYGIYALSERIGISPWFWWGDVPVDVRPIIDANYEHACVELGPAVPYRGFFINDEDWSMVRWNRKKFPNPQIAPEVNYYRHVFELLLRLRGNLLWPAMHPESVAFNAATGEGGVPVNAREAERYGVIMGTHHCEILLRNNEGEWDQWYAEHHEQYHMRGASVRESYDFTLNREALLAYWRERLETNKSCECSLTVGIRGVHDGRFNVAELDRYPGDTTEEKEVAFMKDVIAAQRALIEEVYGPAEAARIPQVLITYKEMNDVYNHGLSRVLEQPEYRNITLMWPDDDYGFLRQVPTVAEAAREGGAGVYYHNSYVGRPTNNTWLNSSQLPLMAEQMRRAWNTGMRRQWVINVGDIKLSDMSTEYFLRLGWNPDACTAKSIGADFVRMFARRDWGADKAISAELADCFDEFSRLIAIRQPGFNLASLNPEGVAAGIDLEEFAFNPSAFGDEAQRWLDRCAALTSRVQRVADALPDARRTAFFEQWYYAVLSQSDTAAEYVNFWEAWAAFHDGRIGDARRYIALSKAARDAIIARNDELDAINDGKWAGFIKYDTHLGDDHDLIEDDQYPNVEMDDGDSDGVEDTIGGITATSNGSARPAGVPAEPVGAAPSESAPLGFVATDGIVACEAEHPTRIIPGMDGSYWAPIANEGQHGDTMKAFPDRGISRPGEGATLEYQVWFERSGTVRGTINRLPTFNEGVEDDGTPRGCRLAVRVNGDEPIVLAGNNAWGESRNRHSLTTVWERNIIRGYEPLQFEATVHAGWNTLAIERVDASVVIDRIVLVAKPLPRSFYGPDESRRISVSYR